MSEEHVKSKIKIEDVCIELAKIGKDIEYIKTRTEELNLKSEEINKKLEQQYVSRLEFEPIKKIVYGMVGISLTILLTAVIYLVVNK